jgi:hypothetical protein
MHAQKQNSNWNPDIGYQSYGQETPNMGHPASERAALELEREMLIQEYRCDRDAILTAIKDALKNRRYSEAQEFVYKYRAAAKTDEDFCVLARMTAQGLEKYQAISKLVTALEATPDDDYRMRLGLCDRILKIQPDNAEYQKEYKRCQKALGLNEQQSSALVATDKPLKTQAQSITGKFAAFFYIWAVLINASVGIPFAALADTTTAQVSIALGMILLTVVQGFLLWPSSKKHAYSISSLFLRFAISFALFISFILMAI